MLIDDEVDNSFSSSTNGQPAYEYETKARSASNSSKESAKGSTTGGSSRSIFKKISRHLSASTSSNPGKSKGDMNHQSQQARISHSLFTSLCKKLEIPTEKAEKSWEAFDLANSGSVGFTFEELIYSTCVATKL